ncbi:MAG: alpha/beta hydrolase [Pseudonocardiaceae bacterium]
MVTFAELRDAQPPLFVRSAENWQQHVTNVRDRGAELESKIRALAPWRGDAAQAARTHMDRLHRQLTDTAERVARIPSVLRVQGEQVDAAQRRLHQALTIEARLNAPVSTGQQQAFLLDFDASSPNGQAVVAAGNPDTADNVVTTVPGTGSRLGEIGGHLDRSDKLVDSAHAADRFVSTAAITWIGYEAPQDLLAAAESRYADNATRDLDQFQDGLRTSHEGPPSRNTVLGHSYGSTVVGHTAHDEGLNADGVIFIGSPGVGVDHASKLGIPPEEVWSSTAENDVIRMGRWAVRGQDPDNPDFGGRTFTSDPGKEDWYGYSGKAHSQYWDVGSSSLQNMGKIVVGKEPE